MLLFMGKNIAHHACECSRTQVNKKLLESVEYSKEYDLVNVMQ